MRNSELFMIWGILAEENERKSELSQTSKGNKELKCTEEVQYLYFCQRSPAEAAAVRCHGQQESGSVSQ